MKRIFKTYILFALFFLVFPAILSSMEINELPTTRWLLHVKGANMEQVVNSAQLMLAKEKTFGGNEKPFVHFATQYLKEEIGYPYLLHIKGYDTGSPNAMVSWHYGKDVNGNAWNYPKIDWMIFEEFTYKHEKYDQGSNKVALQYVNIDVEYGHCEGVDDEKIADLIKKTNLSCATLVIDEGYLEEIEITPKNGDSYVYDNLVGRYGVSEQTVDSFEDISSLTFKVCPLVVNGVDVRYK